MPFHWSHGAAGSALPVRLVDPYKVCLIMDDGGNGAFYDFVKHPLGGPGLPYFQSSYPCLIVGAVL
jgi:hypothetical protein